MPNDPLTAQPPVISSSVPEENTSVGTPQASDMRFATDHGSLAPHQLPGVGQPQVPPSVSPNAFAKMAQNSPVSNQFVKPASATPPGQQITLTITTGANQQQPQTSISQPTTPQPILPAQTPAVQITVQQPATAAASPTSAPSPATQPPATAQDTSSTTTAVLPTELKPPRKISIARWLVIIGLTSVGMKGFFDSLYFIFVEFQNFEKALEDHFIETAQVNPLILKAGLLVFATALSVFFSMQLTMTSSKKLHWFKILASIAVGIISFSVLHYASTINVLDAFKNM